MGLRRHPDGSVNGRAAQVDRSGNRLKVFRPHAGTIPTKMIEIQAGRDGSLMEFKREAMSVHMGLVEVEVSIAATSLGSDPLPTRMEWYECHFLEEPLLGAFSLSRR